MLRKSNIVKNFAVLPMVEDYEERITALIFTL